MKEETKEIIKDIAKRTIKTMLEAALALLATHTTITSVPWPIVANTVAMSGVVTIIVNVVAAMDAKKKEE